MKATVLDEQGRNVTMIMAARHRRVPRGRCRIEQHNDDKGMSARRIAPFQVVLVPMQYHRSHRVARDGALYPGALDAGIDALLDDRDAAGVMFADAELIGIPHRVWGSAAIDDAGRYRAP